MKTEKRSFKISKNMIMHTIENQAGSIEKALLECLMNSVDGGASRVEVILDSNGKDYSVSDNGRGFQTRDEIEKCFDVFGFDHNTEEEKNRGREYGTFGIGRAQLWAFSSNIWHTNEFVLDVDIRKNGLDYLLSGNNDPVIGCTIVGSFYETLNLGELQNVQRNLAKLALYLPIEFVLNGKVVSKTLDSKKWTHKTDDAYIFFTDSGNLDVYNKGVFVCSYSNYEYGKGGVVVTTSKLDLNTARNDILKSKCKVWKKLNKYLRDTATKSNLERATLDDDARKNLLLQLVAGELHFNDLKGKRILPDTKGRFQTLSSLEKTNFRITVADSKHSQIGEKIHDAGSVFVFSPLIIEWFGIDNVEQLSNVLSPKVCSQFWNCKKLETLEFELLKEDFDSSLEIIPSKKYTKKQKALMEIFTSIVKEVPNILRPRFGEGGSLIPERKAVLGSSDVAEAWTDSSSYIAIDKNVLKVLDQGNRGINRVINLVIHEYLHDESSADDHAHSHEFYEKFHDVILDKYVSINTLCILMNKKYVNLLMKNDLALPREFIRESRRDTETLKHITE